MRERRCVSLLPRTTLHSDSEQEQSEIENQRRMTTLVVKAASLSKVAAIRLTTVAIGPGFAHWCSRHLDEAVVEGKKAVTWAPPYRGSAKKQIWL
jgi:hypothetical protein